MFVNIIIITTTLLTFGYAAYLDLKTRIIPFQTWYPLILISSVPTILSLNNTDLLFWASIVASFYMVGYMRLMGGADVWGIIFLVLFFIIPLNIPVIEFGIIIIGALVFGAVISIFEMIKKRSWDVKIPFIPSICISLILYLLLFGAPLL